MPYFLVLAALANTEPRVEQISPTPGLLNGSPVAWDIDNDGDLDSLYARGFSGLHLVRNTIIDEDSLITKAPTSQGLTPARATPQADGDGRSNALEIIHGTDPLTADQAPSDFIQAKLTSGQTTLEFTQLTRATELGVYYDLESSSDLTNWSRIITASPAIQSTDGIWSKVSMEIPQTERKVPNKFKLSTIFADHENYSSPFSP
ncbi:MAG: thrombospondin type 3 repeat-containing protein [Akkermansiaceae bacterium]